MAYTPPDYTPRITEKIENTTITTTTTATANTSRPRGQRRREKNETAIQRIARKKREKTTKRAPHCEERKEGDVCTKEDTKTKNEWKEKRDGVHESVRRSDEEKQS